MEITNQKYLSPCSRQLFCTAISLIVSLRRLLNQPKHDKYSSIPNASSEGTWQEVRFYSCGRNTLEAGRVQDGPSAMQGEHLLGIKATWHEIL